MRTALILGGADCVWSAAIRALLLFTPDTVIGVNNIIIDWPGRLDIACTLHPGKTKAWPGIEAAVKARADRNLPGPYQTWGHKPAPGIMRHTSDWGGSSGLFAVKVALETGHDRIVLAGVPMNEDQAHYFDDKKWSAAKGFRSRGWRKHIKDIAPFTRSMSGWTRELLGEPDKDWLASSPAGEASMSTAKD